MASERTFKILAILTLVVGLVASATAPALAERVRDMVTIAGAPTNQIVGFGLVVGLPGTGDQTTQIPYTQQAITNMLSHEGITLPQTAFMQPYDVASVMVTGSVPSYAEPGSGVNVTVSAIGNATSLAGGVLLPTTLKGGNGLVYGQAQGPLLVSGFAAGAAGSSVRSNTPTVGRIPDGAILSREIPTASVGPAGGMTLLLRNPSFGNAERIAMAINRGMGSNTAFARSPDVIRLRNDIQPNNPVAFMSQVLDVDVVPQRTSPTVVVDAQSGTIVMGGGVQLGPAVVSHGNLTVSIQSYNAVSQPNGFGRGQTVGVRNAAINAKQPKVGKVVTLPHATTLSAVAAALNKIGASPSDLIAIVSALKEAGALKAHLKVE